MCNDRDRCRSLIPRFHRLTRAGPPGECDCSTWQARLEPSLPSRDTSITSVLNQYRTPLTPRIPCTGSCCALALLPGTLPWLIMLDNTCWGGPRAMEHMISEFRRSCKKGQARSRLSIWDLGFRSAGPAQPPGLYVCSSCLLSVNICLLLSASKPRPQVLTMSRLTHCQNLSTIAPFSLAMIRCASATRTGDEDLALGCHAKRDSDADLIIRAHLRPWNRLPLNDDGFVHLTWSSLSMSARYTTHTHTLIISMSARLRFRETVLSNIIIIFSI